MKRTAAPTRSVLYARVSTKDQEREGFSIPAQHKLLRQYAQEHGLSGVVKTFASALMPPCPSRRPDQRSTRAIASRRRSSVVACGSTTASV